MKKLISIILAISLLMAVFAGCGGKTETTALSPENTSITTRDGVTVELGDYVLDGETELTVTRQAAEANAGEGWQIQPYDISLDGITELGDFITLRIPYDPGFCEDGQDPAQCVSAKYKNEATGEWEDAENNELVVTTDHLSTFGAFHVRNEGMRSAYILDVREYISFVTDDMAINALKEIADSGGTAGDATMGAGQRIAQGLLDVSGEIGSTSDWITNPITIRGLGESVFSNELANKTVEGIGRLGLVAVALKGAALVIQSTSAEQGKADTLSFYKDVANSTISLYNEFRLNSAALSVAMSGVWVFDQVITRMFEKGMAMKMEDMGAIYTHFNDEYSGGRHRARTLKDWRLVFIDIAEANPDEEDFKAAVDAELDRYARVFWTISNDEMSEVTGSAGMRRMPYPMKAEIETMITQYKANAYERLRPVFAAVRQYMYNKLEAEYLKSLQEIKAFFNQQITVQVKEEVPPGGERRFRDHIVQFGPLGEGAVKKSWTGRLAGSDAIRFTLLGFIQAGSPNELRFYKPEDDPETAEPELTLNFKLTAPLTEVVIAGAPTFEEVCGEYPGGTMTIKDVFLTDELRAQLQEADSAAAESASEASEEYGCDIAGAILALEEQIGNSNETPFTITATGENTGTVVANGNADSALNASYNPATGELTVEMRPTEETNEMSGTMSGVLQCSGGKDEPVTVKGDLKVSFLFPETDFYVIMTLEGTKGEAASAGEDAADEGAAGDEAASGDE